MQIIEIRADLVVPSGDFFGSMTTKRQSFSGKKFQDFYPMVHGRRLPNGKFQLYEINQGSIAKMTVVEDSAIDWAHAFYREDS